MEKKEIIIVDEENHQIGVGGKMQVHKEGKLHRSFSILVSNHKGEVLLQKRADTKYHSPGLWSNTCCSHPRPNHDIVSEARRRLKEEMGISCELKEAFSFIYKSKVGDLIENEFDHVFIGKFDGTPSPDPQEVAEWKWMDLKELEKDVGENPAKYAYWFRLIINKLKDL